MFDTKEAQEKVVEMQQRIEAHKQEAENRAGMIGTPAVLLIVRSCVWPFSIFLCGLFLLQYLPPCEGLLVT